MTASKRRAPREIPDPTAAAVAPPFRARFNEYLRLFAWASVSGIAAGVIVIGLGGRLAMRILAITSSDAVHGAFTDAGEEINKFTVDGTLGLMIFGGVFGGLVGGWLYGMIRPLLPDATGARLRACAVIGVAVGTPIFVEPGKRDFSILDPLWLAVALFVALSALFAIVVSLIAERWRPFYETTSLRFPRALAFAPMVLVALVPPFLIGGLLVGVVYASRAAWTPPPLLVRGLRVGVALMIGLIGAKGIQEITEIEGRDPRPADFVEPEF